MKRATDILQGFINLIWPHFIGGCELVRPTDEWLIRAGDWREVKLEPSIGEGPYSTIPHVIGHLVKQ